MVIRVFSGVLGILILILCLYFGKTSVLAASFLISILALYELYKAFQSKGYRPIFSLGFLWTCFLFSCVKYDIFKKFFGGLELIKVLALALFLTLFISFIVILLNHKKQNVTDIAVTFFGVLYVPFLMLFLPAIRFMPAGEYIIWIVFIGAWATDTFAYFVGVLWGKRKILPEISPKKTLEGSIGGMLGCTLIMTVFGYYLIKSGIINTGIYNFVIMGIVCSIVSQIGDWMASIIKRYTGVKDFGTIMPGHGGALDRFDSIVVIAPFVYFYFQLFV